MLAGVAKICGWAGCQRHAGCGSVDGDDLGSVTSQVLALREHLITEQVTLVVMEATGDYWPSAR